MFYGVNYAWLIKATQCVDCRCNVIISRFPAINFSSYSNGHSFSNGHSQTPSGRAQLCQLSLVNAHTVVLKPIWENNQDIMHDIVLWNFVRAQVLTVLHMSWSWHKTASTPSEIISNMVCEIWLGIGEGANVIISK